VTLEAEETQAPKRTAAEEEVVVVMKGEETT
jgi:hypothetical protein